MLAFSHEAIILVAIPLQIRHLFFNSIDFVGVKERTSRAQENEERTKRRQGEDQERTRRGRRGRGEDKERITCLTSLVISDSNRAYVWFHFRITCCVFYDVLDFAGGFWVETCLHVMSFANVLDFAGDFWFVPCLYVIPSLVSNSGFEGRAV